MSTDIATSPVRRLTFLRLSALDLRQQLHFLSTLADRRRKEFPTSTGFGCDTRLQETALELAEVELEIEMLLLRVWIADIDGRRGG